MKLQTLYQNFLWGTNTFDIFGTNPYLPSGDILEKNIICIQLYYGGLSLDGIALRCSPWTIDCTCQQYKHAPHNRYCYKGSISVDSLLAAWVWFCRVHNWNLSLVSYATFPNDSEGKKFPQTLLCNFLRGTRSVCSNNTAGMASLHLWRGLWKGHRCKHLEQCVQVETPIQDLPGWPRMTEHHPIKNWLFVKSLIKMLKLDSLKTMLVRSEQSPSYPPMPPIHQLMWLKLNTFF